MGLSKRRRHACAFDSDRDASSKRNRKIITDDEIVEYVANKVLKAAKKIKSRYSNESNPFGDATFVWRKKIEKDIAQGASYSIKAENRRQREIMAEIKKVKRRKEERAIEKAQREEDMALLERERAGAEFQDWKKKEEEFCFDQSKKSSEIRLREGRIKPIDILMTKHLGPSDDFEIDIKEPVYTVFKGLTVKEMEELHDDIKMHLDLDRANTRYWEALLVLCEWELAEVLRKRDTSLEHARVCGLHASVEAEVQTLLRGKSYAELETLRSQIESQMQSGAAKEVEYWEAVLKRLHICKAKTYLKDIHAKMLMERLQRPLEVHNGDLDGSYSPQLQHSEEDEDAIIDPEEDNAILERKRIAVLEERAAASKPIPPEDNNDLEKSAFKAMGGALEEGDAVFGSNNEVNLDSKVYYSWQDKYRPRKPKYCNRVHTGYEWNKYNQNHYDHDNPPPKMVQGYKFNIFYPDLLDKIKAPTYSIKKDGDETCIIRFHAGPPYEDIAFRIVDKEWDYSHKKGFKCTFERGILQVYFNFKGHRYRR